MTTLLQQLFTLSYALWIHTTPGLLAIGAVGLDVGVRQGKGLKLASAGLERLVLKDSERETHSGKRNINMA